MKFILHSEAIRKKMISDLSCMDITSKTFEVVVKEHKVNRSADANKLYWSWVDLIGRRSFKVERITKEQRTQLHNELRHQFLGYETIVFRNGKSIEQLKSTASLSVSDMYLYMLQIDVWCQDRGCFLPRPEDSAYDKYREASQ